jgi:glycosyltransferase involved in cell wall biosynthesis
LAISGFDLACSDSKNPNGNIVSPSWRRREPRPAAPYFKRAIDAKDHAFEPKLVVRGVDRNDESLATLFNEIKPTAFEWEPFSANPRLIEQDIMGASCVIMPSQTEAFGLVALEAIAAGTPVIVSSASGLGRLLLTLNQEHPGTIALDNDVVLDIDENPTVSAKQWVGPIRDRLSDRTAAFAKADALRKDLTCRVNWHAAVSLLIARVEQLNFCTPGDTVAADNKG